MFKNISLLFKANEKMHCVLPLKSDLNEVLYVLELWELLCKSINITIIWIFKNSFIRTKYSTNEYFLLFYPQTITDKLIKFCYLLLHVLCGGLLLYLEGMSASFIIFSSILTVSTVWAVSVRPSVRPSVIIVFRNRRVLCKMNQLILYIYG